MISSSVIKEPNPKLIISSAYRAAFSEVLKILSKDYAQKNISCINIAPGPMNTDRTKELIENVEEFQKTLPYGKTWGSCRDWKFCKINS